MEADKQRKCIYITKKGNTGTNIGGKSKCIYSSISRFLRINNENLKHAFPSFFPASSDLETGKR